MQFNGSVILHDGNLDDLYGMPRPCPYLECIVWNNCIFVTLRACIVVLVVLHILVSSGSSPEVCGYFVQWCVCHICMYETSSKAHKRHILYVSIPDLNISQGLAGKGYGPVILEECSTKTIFTGISLQDKWLHMVIIDLGGPEKHAAYPGL